jgi:hypothetical protein
MTFKIKYDGVTVTLPAPDHGDEDQLQVTRIQRRNRGGKLITYSDPAWPSTNIKRFIFSSLILAQRTALFNIIVASLGQPVEITDHTGTIYDALITNPNNDIHTVRDDCDYTTRLDVECIPSP